MKQAAFISAALVSLSIFGHAVQAQAPRYQAVWHQDQATSLVTATLSRSNFLDTGQTLAESGLRLIDVETTIQNGTRVYAGLWTEGTGSNLFSGPLRPLRMRRLRAQRRDQGMRLVDFEIFRTANGQRRYLGVWRNGTGREILTRPMPQTQFLARGEALTASGLRLIDVEVERRDGRTLYSGLFREGSGSNFLTTPLSRTAFNNRRDQMVADGLELTDIERVRINGSTRFVGVWSSGDGESRISRLRRFGQFFIFAQSQFNDDKHTRDFELVPVPDESVGPDTDRDPDPGPDPEPGSGPTTADLPALPDWLELSGGSRVVVDFTLPVPEAGFRMTLPIAMLPENLPRNGDGDVVIPDMFCGLRMIDASEVIWETVDGQLETAHPFNHIESFTGSFGGQPLEPFRLGGIDFTGPIGGCTDDNEPWQFFFPITQDSTGGPPPTRRLTVEMPGGEIEFLNFNIHAGEPLDAHELFDEDVFETLIAITESFDETGEENGYCTGVNLYMEAVCTQAPDQCPVATVQQLPSC